MAPGMMTTTNNSNITNWNLEKGYKKIVSGKKYPHRTFNAGLRGGLEASVSINQENLEYYCHQHGLGFKVILSVPGDTYRMSRQSFRIPLFEDARIAIKPKLITTSDQLRKYHPNRRQCFYHHERRLRFFKTYSQNKCETECLSNFTKQECGCVRFFMPSIPFFWSFFNFKFIFGDFFFALAGDNDTKICGGKHAMIRCYQMAETKLFRQSASKKNVGKSFRNECNCLPACTSIEYNADVSHIKFDFEILFQHERRKSR